jgi:polysaccharide export outer membrane protein
MYLSKNIAMLGLLLLGANSELAFAQATAPTDLPVGSVLMPLPTPSNVPTGSASLSGDRQYTLGVGDVIEIAVVGRSDFNGRVRIGSDGAVLLPFLGAVPASDRTPGQLSDEIRTALAKGGYFSDPVVRIDVVAVASRYVTILGAVGTPGLMPLDRRYRLSEILARSGGKSEMGVDYVVLTTESGGSKQYKMSDLATGNIEQDPYVSSGDKIYVPAAKAEVFYINGQVTTPGSFPVTEGMTVRMALAVAGGLTEQGSDKKVKVNRKGVNLKGVQLDKTVVEPSDILTVGERLF